MPIDPEKNVIAAIRTVMAKLPAIDKGGTAPAKMGGYKFRGIEQILGATQDLCAEHGVVFVPRVTLCEVEAITIAGNRWTDTHLTVEYDVYGPGGPEDMVVAGPVIGTGRDNTDKGTSKAMSTCFKQILTEVFQIGDGATDTESYGAGDAEPAAEPDPVATPEAEEAMHTLGELIRGLAGDEIQPCKDFLSAQFGRSDLMAIEQIREATAVVAGWPSTDPMRMPARDPEPAVPF